MTNYEYLIDKYPNVIKQIIANYIGQTVICLTDDICSIVSDCSDCPFNNEFDVLNTGDADIISDWLEEERKDD